MTSYETILNLVMSLNHGNSGPVEDRVATAVKQYQQLQEWEKFMISSRPVLPKPNPEPKGDYYGRK